MVRGLTVFLFLRIRIGVVSFERLYEFEFSLPILLFELELEFFYLKLSFPLFHLCIFCFSLDALDLLLKHLPLIVNLISHLLDLIRKHLQLLVISKFLWLSLTLSSEKFTRNISVESLPLGRMLGTGAAKRVYWLLSRQFASPPFLLSWLLRPLPASLLLLPASLLLLSSPLVLELH